MKLHYLPFLVIAAAPACAADWNAPQEPFALYGNTYYVGPHGVSSVLITSPAGHILIDGGSPESPAQIAQHIRQLGFRIEDVKYILNSHEHFDHAGGIAELQRLSGAAVLTSTAGAAVLRTGLSNKDDPQFTDLPSTLAPVARVEAIADGGVLTVGPLRVTAHYTPGHAPGGVSWTWQSVEEGVAANMVYADSLSAAAAKPYRFRDHPAVVASLTRSIAAIAALPCDILISAHPEASELWERFEKAKVQGHTGFIDRNACRAYAAKASARQASVLAKEGGQP
ncbi:subclass B3 metallo-beta-lactamase [Massilia sp. S19_KUP03_FR1]|uniref:subclass B3 metallo-beta-lactamase n=1 Tax=Massilia sp. S19_KUP03_FR1 TaxID=3025503 RepID=UPI002FCD81D4